MLFRDLEILQKIRKSFRVTALGFSNKDSIFQKLRLLGIHLKAPVQRLIRHTGDLALRQAREHHHCVGQGIRG